MLGVFEVVVRALEARRNVDDADAISDLQPTTRRAALASSSSHFPFCGHLLLVLDVHVLSVDYAFVLLLRLLPLAVSARSCPRFRRRPTAWRARSLRSLVHLLCQLVGRRRQ